MKKFKRFSYLKDFDKPYGANPFEAINKSTWSEHDNDDPLKTIEEALKEVVLYERQIVLSKEQYDNLKRISISYLKEKLAKTNDSKEIVDIQKQINILEGKL